MEEHEECLDEIVRRFRERKYYSVEELEILTARQLEVLTKQLVRLVGYKDIKKETKNSILRKLWRRRESAIERASEQSIWPNPNTEILAMVPVINEKTIPIPIQMKMIVNKKGEGRASRELDNKILIEEEAQTDYSSYWMLDVRTDEVRHDSSYLTVPEIIAYALHSPELLDKYVLNAGSSRFKRGRRYPNIYLSNIDGYPFLFWSKNNYKHSYKPQKVVKPSCNLRLIH